MKHRTLAVWLLLPLLASCGNAKDVTIAAYFAMNEKTPLVYRDGFKVLQLTDIHWSVNTNAKVQGEYLTRVVKETNPDFIMVAVLVTINSKTNTLVVPPIVYARGFAAGEDTHVIRHAQMHAEEAIREIMQEKVTFGEIKTTIKNAVSKYIYRKTERNPMIVPVIMALAAAVAFADFGSVFVTMAATLFAAATAATTTFFSLLFFGFFGFASAARRTELAFLSFFFLGRKFLFFFVWHKNSLPNLAL